MITYNVSIPEDKQSFFREFFDMIGADYEKKESIDFELTQEQKQILLQQEHISLDQCMDAEDFYKEMKKKYDL